MIKCTNCGFDVSQDDNFCSKCGKNLGYSSPITTHLGNSLPLQTQPVTWSGRVSRSIIRLTHFNQRPQGLNTIVRTLRESVEAREKAQRRTLAMTYILVAVLIFFSLAVLVVELHAHGIMH